MFCHRLPQISVLCNKLYDWLFFLEKKCTTPAELCNGDYTCTNDLYEFDSVCFPKCNQGYETELSRYLKCNGDSWEGTNTILDCEGINLFNSF